MTQILLLGDPRLREPSEPVTDFGATAFRSDVQELHQMLDQFRAKHGFGRAISAPQIAIGKRIIAARLDDKRLTFVNPRITWRSEDTFTMWDDCMSFPFLLVRLRRHDSISIEYEDEEGQTQQWNEMPRAEAELLQHEIDHLNGVLAVDLALDKESMVSREVFEKDFDRFQSMVDYVIPGPAGVPPAMSIPE